MLTVFLIWPTHALDSKNKSQRQQISHTSTEMNLAWENKLREKIQSQAQNSLWKWCIGLALVQRCSLHSWGSTAGSGRVGFASPCPFDVLAILPHSGAMQNAPCRAHRGSTLPHAIQLDMAGTSAWLPSKSLSLRSNKRAENRKKKKWTLFTKMPNASPSPPSSQDLQLLHDSGILHQLCFSWPLSAFTASSAKLCGRLEWVTINNSLIHMDTPTAASSYTYMAADQVKKEGKRWVPVQKLHTGTSELVRYWACS